jgi:hypothetical protein
MIYALFPVMIIAMASYAVSFYSLFSSIVSRNYTFNDQIANTIGNIIGSYANQADKLSKANNMLEYLSLNYSNSFLYGEFYGRLAAKIQLKSILIGMESTGHCWYSLANWLVEKGLNVVLRSGCLTISK